MFIRRMATLLSAGAAAIGISMAAAGAAQAAVPPSSDWNEIIASFDHNFNNTLCVDDPGGSLSVGTQLELWHCHGSGSDGGPQRWRFIPEGTSADGMTDYLIALRPSLDQGPSLCVGFPGGFVPASGQRLILVQCGSSAAVLWTMETAPGTNPLMGLADQLHNLCIAYGNFSDSNGTPLIATTCGATDESQVWALG